jgi:hypothetical protein
VQRISEQRQGASTKRCEGLGKLPEKIKQAKAQKA